jgi:hypothetical protein
MEASGFAGGDSLLREPQTRGAGADPSAGAGNVGVFLQQYAAKQIDVKRATKDICGQVTEDHFAKTVQGHSRAAQNTAQHAHERAGTERHEMQEDPTFPEQYEGLPYRTKVHAERRDSNRP